jgi:predicted DNA-binding protein
MHISGGTRRQGTTMKRTTIMLPADLRTRAMRYARKRGITLGATVRESLEEKLRREAGDRRNDPLFADEAVAIVKSGPKDLAANHDGYLYGDDA